MNTQSFFFRDKTVLFLRNFYVDDFKCKNQKSEIIRIRIEPDIASPQQCFKCFGLNHSQENCEQTKRCGHCMSSEHETTNCNCTKNDDLKCSICGVKGHSSLDRRCVKFRAARRDMANEAVAQITKTTTNKSKKLAKDISHNLENSSSYAHVTNSQQLDNDLQERLRKLETNAGSQNDQSRIQNDIKKCFKETENIKSGLIDLNNIVNTNKTEFEKNMLNLTKAITSTNKLAETFEKNTQMLEQNMVQIAKREIDVLR